ncbi:MAG: type II toxin-antitoxin system Phd/YefM family antitoxin [Candidatus Paceibacterota bacterium]|jgi:PHD/YefM family antitoxin component YafN of YafNO toxin-antitoxin module
MKTLSTTEARKQFSDLIDHVRQKSEAVAIGRWNEPEVLLIPYPREFSREVNEITKINASSPSFDFLYDEPDLYSMADLKHRYV